MPNGGYIKLYRKMMDWEWYADSNTKCVFLHLLLSAQYEPCRYKGIQLEAGQVITSVHDISEQTGVSVRSVRTAIEHLKSTSEVTSELTRVGCSNLSVFTIKNYADYQTIDKPIDKSNDNRATSDRQVTDKCTILRNKEVKKGRSSSARACAREDAPDGAPPLPAPEQFYLENGFAKKLSPYIRQQFAAYREKGMADDLLLYALREAAASGNPCWPYARSILERCDRENIRTAAENEKHRRPKGSGRNTPVTRPQPSGGDMLAGAADRPRRLKRKE